MIYYQVNFANTSQDINEILVALLEDIDFEGFEEKKNELKAYISPGFYNPEKLQQIADQLRLKYDVTEIPETNWNAVWESNFSPVTVDDFCMIRADFHQPSGNFRHEIIITPKMSFGTGHHPTTYMMIRQMKEIIFTGKSVLDFGTGTGVLGILAEKSGASRIVAIDYDDLCIENAKENSEKNNCSLIEIRKSDSADINETFDIILANVTRNVILENFENFGSRLTQSGLLLLSGILPDDELFIIQKASEYQFLPEKKLWQENWICMKFIKS